MAAVDADAWSRVRVVQFTFGGRNRWVWDRAGQRAWLRQGELDVRFHTDTRDGYALKAGRRLAGPYAERALEDVEALDARLGGDGDVIAEFGAAGEAALGDDEAVGADDDVVGDLDEVVDFGALTDDGFAEAGAVDGGVCADFDVVVDFNDADLVDFDVFSFVEFVAIAIGADDAAGLEDDAVAEAAAFADGDVGHDAAVVSDGDFLADDGVGSDFGAVADGGTGHDDGAGVDADFVGVENCAGFDDGAGMDAGLEFAGAGGEVSDDGGEGQ